jgi:hypothetical protein
MEQHAKLAKTTTMMPSFFMFPLPYIESPVTSLNLAQLPNSTFTTLGYLTPPRTSCQHNSAQFLVVCSNLHSTAPQGNEEAPPGVSHAQGLSAAR